MYFYLDGYNLLFGLTNSKQTLATQRQQFIQFLQTQFAAHHIKGTLVFDGSHRREEESGLSYRHPLEIAFAPKGQSADAYIIEKVEAEAHRRQIIVVTNDRGLSLQARSLGATVQKNDAFVQFLKKKSMKKKKGGKVIVETEKNITRLLKIFEERFNQDEET